MGDEVEIAAWFAVWTLLGAAGTIALVAVIRRIKTKISSRARLASATLSWFTLSTLGVWTYFIFQNALMAKHGEANAGFAAVMIFVWVALSTVGTTLGVVVETIRLNTRRR